MYIYIYILHITYIRLKYVKADSPCNIVDYSLEENLHHFLKSVILHWLRTSGNNLNAVNI